MMPDRLYEALQYRKLGYHPVPFYPHSKTPAFAEGEILPYRERVPTDRELAAMFRDPARNIGLITGANNLHILDIDGDLGRQSLKRFPPLPRTPMLITSRGAQYYFQGNETLPTKPDLHRQAWISCPLPTKPSPRHRSTPMAPSITLPTGCRWSRSSAPWCPRGFLSSWTHSRLTRRPH